MRVALIGAGTIAGLVLADAGRGALPGIEIIGLLGRPASARARAVGAALGIPVFENREALFAAGPQALLEAASHEAVRQHLVPALERGISVIVLSAGALSDERLRVESERTAKRSGARLYVPSGGIGGLDALKAACIAGVDEVSISVAKPPAAWKNIPYVQRLGIDLDRISAAATLFDGSAAEGVPHFPQNVNIAAVLSMAGVGFARTGLKVIADPALTRNTHTIRVSGRTGRFSVVLENVPDPDNPKTAWLACYSALAALRELASPVRYGT